MQQSDKTTLPATESRLSGTLVGGEQASVQIHKMCYCSYTSKHHVTKRTAKTRKDDPTGDDVDPPPAARLRRSQVQNFDFREQCLFCAAVCKPVDPKHPNRLDRVVQCEVRGIPDAPPFKDVVLCHCAIVLDGDFPGLDDVLGEVGATHGDLLKTAATFVLALYVSQRRHPSNLPVSHCTHGTRKVLLKSRPCLPRLQI